MTGDGTTPDIWHLPISTWRVRVGVALCIAAVVTPFGKTCVMWDMMLKQVWSKSPLWHLVVWDECLQGAVMHCSSDRQTEWYKLHTAGRHQFYITSSQWSMPCVLVPLHSSRGMQSNKPEAWTGQDVNGSWLNQTSSVCLITCGWRIQVGRWRYGVWCFPFCSHLQSSVGKTVI